MNFFDFLMAMSRARQGGNVSFGGAYGGPAFTPFAPPLTGSMPSQDNRQARPSIRQGTPPMIPGMPQVPFGGLTPGGTVGGGMTSRPNPMPMEPMAPVGGSGGLVSSNGGGGMQYQPAKPVGVRPMRPPLELPNRVPPQQQPAQRVSNTMSTTAHPFLAYYNGG